MSDNAEQRKSTESPVPLVVQAGVLLAAAGAFALIARGVATQRTRRLDTEARDWVQAHRTPAGDVAVKPLTLLSLPILVVSATTALALWLRSEKRGAAAFTVALTPVLAATAGQSFTTFLPQQSPPDAKPAANGEAPEAGFPSGHTTGVTAEALVIGYVLAREKLLPVPAAVGLVAWPLLTGSGRLYRDRHWTSDIVAGLAAGTAVAAAISMLYEMLKSRRSQ